MTLADIAYFVGEIVVVTFIGGSAFYFVKGTLRSSSEGSRLAGGVQAVVVNKPRVGRWAAWLGVEAAIEDGMRETRGVDDPLNVAVAWGAANALFSVHRGSRAAVREGLKGAVYGGAVWFVVSGLDAFMESRKVS
ncbi:mitochondrial import inner membrane translocase subunit TIM17-2-like [Lolium perenne]|uniref:mitochondrial import inner membrane translocase subunit TIM17-2-like n=1 Tax=Lolium perenne TaxID=4522 RepID=UPI0021F65073|nr:mitochondrial import inner membrane translocase subunit TIM17-2-like [Lolium perenne]